MRASMGNASDPKAKFVGGFARLFADTAYKLVKDTEEVIFFTLFFTKLIL